ncbi:prepilin-type N-terminal cleavage/methylation domain-containing protein [Marinithermus hydrothermalis]|uniref:Prepilin-type N-terminal cleavage/methylation domain-containing protein n=1 Tax=Marinithermus hydrothermalis (strain DSM 14884 / JCM 11576 / T1) TaxID=869210 RepID=F2NL49_MARHT|nr:prepilin-type N-terminal cleavage/methylation domain-containing protein [Marinithermus hydrothermalis]AEB11452.1 hypothetical protein Marky_0702 [Marinithermus hydrothermalis DSM 14884]
MRNLKQQGFTLIEFLIVATILGVALSIAAFEGWRMLRGQEQRAAVSSVQQLFWQGATAAASRGARLELVRVGRVLEVRAEADGRVLRRFELPDGVTTNLPEGRLAVFTPPGRVNLAASFPNPFTVRAGGRTYRFTVSLIGEVKAEVVP